jgi:hypothetical protein
MNQTIEEIPQPSWKARTLEDPQIRIVYGIRQWPTGRIICPFCRKETAFDAASVNEVLQTPGKYGGTPPRQVDGMCNECTGYLQVFRREERLHVLPGAVPVGLDSDWWRRQQE